MGKTVEIYEKTVYVWDCPNCGYVNEENENLINIGYCYCSNCAEGFKPIPA